MEVWRNDLNDMPAAGTFNTAIDTGPGIFVVLVHGALATGVTCQVRVLCNSNYVQDPNKWYAIEDVTLSPQTGTDVISGFQSTPIPLPDNTFRFFTRIILAGSSGALIMYEVLKL